MTPRIPTPTPVRATPLYAALLVVVLGSAALGWWLRSPHVPTSGRPVAGAAPQVLADPDGVPVNAELSVGGETVRILSVVRTPMFRNRTAAEGQEFIAVTVQPVPGSALSLAAELEAARLRAGGTEYRPVAFEAISTQDSQATSAVTFAVPRGTTDLELVTPSTTVALPTLP